MKNQLGDMPNVSLDDEIHEEDKIPETKIDKKSDDSNLSNNNNYYTNKDKLNKTLTIILIIVVSVIVLILLGFGINKLINMYNAKKNADDNKAASDHIGIESGPGDRDLGDEDPILSEDWEWDQTGTGKKLRYKGFEVVGYIRIPKTGINYPIIKPMSNKSLEVSVTLEHITGIGINKPGNVTISGHNYKNEQFFANNYRIENGDKVYIKDMDGVELEYIVYNIQEVGENDKSFVQRNTNGGIEVTLSTCTDNVVNRIVIFAKHEPKVVTE